MAEQQIRFDDGASYERMMGVWSRIAGEIFIDWVAPAPGLRWIDVGCGNGAFTELLVERCAPKEVKGVDPSEGQLAFARTRHTARVAEFREGNAMALPFSERTFDAAVMALVIFFVPEPAKGVAEMVRVVRPGATISAYAWDIPGGGLPSEPILSEIRAMGLKTPSPPSAEVSRIDALRDVWTKAGLEGVETREITVQRTFTDFDEFWTINLLGPSVSAAASGMTPADIERLKSKVRTRLPADSAGRITYSSRANAVKGRVPK
jgi:ubiquinone/menaquinone biosynthesis C-methylase UbiE